MFKDNKTSFTLTRDPKSQNCIKLINKMHQQIEKLIEDKELDINQISNSLILANSLTKALFAKLFKKY